MNRNGGLFHTARILGLAAACFLNFIPVLMPALSATRIGGILEICTSFGIVKIAAPTGVLVPHSGKPEQNHRQADHCPLLQLQQASFLTLLLIQVIVPAALVKPVFSGSAELNILSPALAYRSRAPPVLLPA